MHNEFIATCGRLCEEAMQQARWAERMGDYAAAIEATRDAQAYSRIAFAEAQS